MDKADQEIMRKTYLKYIIMKVRAKLSFEALLKRNTLIEMFGNQIIRSYEELVDKDADQKAQSDNFESLLSGNLTNLFLFVIRMNS